MITQQDLIQKLYYLIGLPLENECVEFKEATNDSFKTDKIGKYFSALSNEANLLNSDFAWLLFGIEGKITNTALLLLGKPEAKRFLFPNARITYVYINSQGLKEDYEQFDPPFLLERNNILKRLKHKDSKFKILPNNNTLTPIEAYRYDNWVILEAMNNCIAHQDYSKKEKIIITEKANYELKFKNSSTFYYGTIEDYIFLDDFTPPRYRNAFLAEAMEKIGMLDTVSKGIKLMFNIQKEKYLPLPEYILSSYVELTIYADNKSNEYTNQLFINKTIDLGTVFLMDKKQKNFPIDDKDYKYVIISFLNKQRRAGRNDIDNLLLTQLDENLTNDKKRKKITNLLYSLSKENKIRNISNSTKKPIWVLS